MTKALDLTGCVFGRITVVRRGPLTTTGHTRWWCVCACGKERLVHTKALRRGVTKSCGCLATDLLLARSTKHGEGRRGLRSPEFRVWVGIRSRCLNEKSHLYRYYGGRGIDLCKRWAEARGYENFLADVGRKPSLLHTLDRIDNDKGYQPGNVRWVTMKEQMRNTRHNRRIILDGRELTLVEWAERFGVPYKRLHNRVNKLGWDLRRALTTSRRGT